MYQLWNQLWNHYHSFDTRSKRCLIIDLYSLLFIILPERYFLSRNKGSIWILLLVYLLCKVRGKNEVFIKDKGYIYSGNTKKRVSIL